MAALSPGDRAPDFTLNSHRGESVTLSSLRGTNVVVAFFPLAFTPVWTEQIPSYEAALARFDGMNTRVVGVSVDHVPALTAWAESLGGISFPLLSDFWPHGEVARSWGVFREEEGVSERAIFVIDADGTVAYADVHDITDRPDNDVLFAELAKLEPDAAGRLLAAEQQSPQERSGDQWAETVQGPDAAGLLMYCRSWCPDCRRARDWLDQRGIPYIEVDVDSDAEARDRAAALNEGRLHTPTFVVGTDVCVDFRPERLTELLDMM